MKYLISSPDKPIKTSIGLPASKSISNRVLILNALSYSPYPINNLSDSDDSKVLEQVLNSDTNKFDIGHAGTAMRFLTAYLSKIVGEWELTGSERMKQRPIKILVDVLKQMGAKIEYAENEGFPPLHIWGSHLKGGKIELDGSISSQYITALLMIAPTLEGGLSLHLKKNITSKPYINLTLQLLKKFGIHYTWNNNIIDINEQPFKPVTFNVESDWSGASYWYEIAALSKDSKIELKNLVLSGLQGDEIICKWFELFGVNTQKTKNGLIIKKNQVQLPLIAKLDLNENPDIAQTMAAMCVVLKVPFHFTGLETLKIKETNRIAALQNELLKFGAILTEPEEGELYWNGTIEKNKILHNPIIKTYNDHRMAMAFAPLCLTGNPLQIEDPMVVTKSYPGFWKDIQHTGFNIQEIK